MNRSLSTTLVRPGSETDSDDQKDEFTPRPRKNVLFHSMSVKHAASGAAGVSAAQLFLHFVMFLNGCGVTIQDILIAVIPIIFGFVAIGFLVYGLLHNFGYSLKPFILYQVLAVLYVTACSVLFLICFIHLHNITLLPNIHKLRMYTYLLELTTVQRAGFALFLIANFTASVFCLHIGIVCHNHFESGAKYVSADVTEL